MVLRLLPIYHDDLTATHGGQINEDSSTVASTRCTPRTFYLAQGADTLAYFFLLKHILYGKIVAPSKACTLLFAQCKVRNANDNVPRTQWDCIFDNAHRKKPLGVKSFLARIQNLLRTKLESGNKLKLD